MRLCTDLSYDRLLYMANYDSLLRQAIGVETKYGIPEKEFGYQNILDNASLLEDQTVRQINEIIVSFGHNVFRKKDKAALMYLEKARAFLVKVSQSKDDLPLNGPKDVALFTALNYYIEMLENILILLTLINGTVLIVFFKNSVIFVLWVRIMKHI